MLGTDKTPAVSQPDRGWAGVWWTVVVGGGLLAGSLLLARRSLQADFFFDEMWRADMIRAANTRAQYIQHNTALAPGWLYGMRLATVFEDRRPILRLLALGCFPLALTIVWGLLVRMLRSLSRPLNSARWLALCVVALATTTRGIAGSQPYFNNYGFELLVGATVAWSCFICSPRQLADEIDEPRTRHLATWALGTFLVAGPFFVQSALLLWPAACWYFAAALRRSSLEHNSGVGERRSAWRRGVDNLRNWRVIAIVAGGGAVGVLTGLAFYEPVAGAGDTEEFWRDVAIKDGPDFTKLIDNFGAAVRDSALATSSPSWPLIWLAALAAAVGARTAWRAWPGFIGLLVSAQLGAVLFSAVAGWPVAPVRVNLGFAFLGFVLAPLGAMVVVEHLAQLAARGLPTVQRHLVSPAIAAVVGVAGVATTWPSSIGANAGSKDVFARGMTDDLLTIGNGTSVEGLVLSYHVMSHWYAHDLLVNSSWPSRNFRVVRDDGSARLFEDVDRTVAAELGDATDVWCVIPFELGPERALAACQITDPRLVETSRQRMARIELVRFQRTDI